ncbi:High-affinity branched-chain amino acid transport ATP-binding protein BraG [Hyphomicrobiales bacterium]|nr:High-affinity branched-chain amino acid transport ATP-binding protein BraG [Hyphomicrobiales bacterium]CAH1675623.1 High-affinity branched-chain amino acid transport ATP-binding protein BraG [Hyphomicrobiales bacterium]
MSSAHEATLLQITNLESWYGETQALHGINLTVRKSEVVSILGRNGAGKSTLLKSIMGIVRKKRGEIRYCGERITQLSSLHIAARGIAFCPEHRGIFSTLTVTENLLLPPVVKPGGMSLDEVYELFPILKERGSSIGTTLSGGEQQMLAIARILRTGADTFLLDEPTEGLAPVYVKEIGRLLGKLRARGYTIVIVEQNYRFVSSIADRHFMIDNGHVVGEYNGEDLKNNLNEVERILGV